MRPLWWRRTLQAGLGGLLCLAAFFVGVGVERDHPNAVLTDPAPVTSKPTPGLITQQGGPDCDLWKRYPSGAAFKKDEGCPVATGKGFTVGYHTVRDGWTIRGDVLTMVLVNNNPGPISGFFGSFHLKRYDGTLVEILWCDSEAMDAGEARPVVCKPLDQNTLVEPFDNVSIV